MTDTPFVSQMMVLFRALLFIVWMGSAQAQSLLAQTVHKTEQTTTELLVHAPEGFSAAKPVWFGLRIKHTPDWHTYWKNSGDSGLPTQLEWTLPPGVEAGAIGWPTPKKFPLGSLANYGYDGTVLLAVPVRLTPAFTGARMDVTLNASWLACRTECIPEDGTFHLSLPAASPVSLHGIDFEDALAKNPKSIALNSSQLSVEGQFLHFSSANLPSAWHGKTLEVFPELPAIIEPGAPWQQSWSGADWTAKLPLSSLRTDAPQQLPLVVTLANSAPHGQPALQGVRLDLPVKGVWPAAQGPATTEVSAALEAALNDNRTAHEAATQEARSVDGGLISALIGALLGGLILNLMPCVFPVLAIKVLAFTQSDNGQPGSSNLRSIHRASGLAYTAGVVLSFVALGGLLVGLRAAGELIGWGFQLQSPAVVALLAMLFTLIGLNLAGLFEFGSMLPSRLATLQARHPTADSFLTGVLATAVASPCTAPFMGASLGLALGLPAEQALLVFAFIGFGMALPYLAASWIPAVAHAMPRPGAWMNTLRQFLAFPMFATVVWLVWVLGQQTGMDGAAALLALLIGMAMLIWAWGLRGSTRVWVGGAAFLACTGLAIALGPVVVDQSMNPAMENHTSVQQGPGGSHPAVRQNWQAWSEAGMASLQSLGKPVFVDFTAAWCVTCQYNKKTTLSDPEVLALFEQHGITLLRADWTRRDPAVTQALSRLGRNGVPVYALYRTTGKAPVVLSEILSVNDVRQALLER